MVLPKLGRLHMTKVYNRLSEKEKRRTLRNHMTEHEIILWSRLKNRQIKGYKFRRQYSVGPYILDFYCPIKKLAIEVDGCDHYTPGGQAYDQDRAEYLSNFDIRILRFSNEEVRKKVGYVLCTIGEALGE